MEVSVRELKSRLSKYLRRVADGEELTVTSHGKAVARLVPARARRRVTPSEAELVNQFRALPSVRAGNGRKSALPRPPVRIRKDEKTMAEIVAEQRG